MIFQGRELDVLSLWGELCDMPNSIPEPLPMFLDKTICPNPEHDTHKRHFQINTAKPFVHCFARCGISGSYEHAVATIMGLRKDDGELDLKAARRHIMRHTRTSLGKKIVSAYTGRGTRKTFSPDDPVARDERALKGGAFQFLPKEARAYLDARGIDTSTRGKWELGWHEAEERLVIPAYDERGNFRFLIKRQVKGGGSLKYLYTEGAIKTSILFGACYLDENAVASDGLVLVEGSIDTIRLHQIGVRNAVGILGSGLSKKQVRLIDKFNPRRVFLFFDKDSAGVDNIRDAKTKLTRLPLFVVRFPKHRSDPAEMTREEVERALKRAIPVHEFFSKSRNATRHKEVLASG